MVTFNKLQIGKMVLIYKQGHIDEHFATFEMCLNRELTKLLKDSAKGPDVDKKQYLMVKAFARGFFSW